MDEKHITGMLKVLKSQIKNNEKAKILLERYWRDKIAIIWEINQIHRAANERGMALTNDEARNILETLIQQHNPQYGLNWQMVVDEIEEEVLGRKLTRPELMAFVNRDIITIHKP